MMEMPYRRLGSSGLKVSALSFGSWVTFHKQIDLLIMRESKGKSQYKFKKI